MNYRKTFSKVIKRSFSISPSSRRLGDQARDQKDWSQAVIDYQQHLAEHPQDQAIWVQFGHALKESGDSHRAINAYKTALILNADDVETYEHFLHLLRVTGSTSESVSCLQQVYELRPLKMFADALKDAHADVVGVKQTREYGKWIIEIDDMLDYLRNHKTPSGIQRVQIGIIKSILGFDEKDQSNYSFVRTGRNAPGFWRLTNKSLEDILTYITLPEIEQDCLTAKISAAEDVAEFLEPQSGQVYLILGAFWGFGANAARYIALKKCGVCVGVYLYDTIPVSYPEYCAAGLVSEFTLALGDGLHSFDFIFTISSFVADDMKALMSTHNLPEIPVQPVLLAHQLHASEAPRETSHMDLWGKKIEFLKEKKFVLMVSTIEARKNHIYLYNVWKEMIKTLPEVPDLVFVGRFGWRMNDFHSILVDTDFLDGRIHVLHDISDADLETLYHACEFTVFPSMVEGWGLPVGESLAHGRPCVASNTSSVPEVGGDLVDYVDPLNIRSGIETISNMVVRVGYREERAQQIRRDFVPRTWRDVTEDMVRKLHSLGDIRNRPFVPTLLKAGEVFEPEKFAVGEKIPSSYLGRPLRPILAESWYPLERNLGAWMRGKNGFLEFVSTYEEGTCIRLLLDVVMPPWTEHSLHVSMLGDDKDTKREAISIKANQKKLIVIDGVVGANGVVTVNFCVKGETIGQHPGKGEMDTREFYFGLQRIVYFFCE